MILPLRFTTPRMNAGVRGTPVMGIRPMISFTFRISTPYSSDPEPEREVLLESRPPSRRPLVRPRHHTSSHERGEPHEPAHVDDQSDASVGHDRSAGDAGRVLASPRRAT